MTMRNWLAARENGVFSTYIIKRRVLFITVLASEREAIYRVSCQRRIEHFLRMYHGVERYDELSEHSDEGYFVRLSAGS